MLFPVLGVGTRLLSTAKVLRSAIQMDEIILNPIADFESLNRLAFGEVKHQMRAPKAINLKHFTACLFNP